MAIETLRENPTNQIESLAKSLPDQEENQLIFAFLDNPIIAAKIEQIPDYFRQAGPQEKLLISSDIAGWAFEWLAFTHLQQHTKYTLFSPQDVSGLYQKLYSTRESKNFFFQGNLLNNTRIPDMIEIRNAKKTLQITKIIEAKAGQLNNGLFRIGNLYGNLFLGIQERGQLVGQAMHEINADLEEKQAVLHPKCKVTFAVPSNFVSPQSKYHLAIIPISSTTLNRLVQAITLGSS